MIYEIQKRHYEFEVTPICLWNYTLHSYVHRVTIYDTGKVIGTDTGGRDTNFEVLRKPGLTKWPYRQLAFKAIRSVTMADGTTHRFQPLEDIYRAAFNSVIQMTAGDIFKRAMLNVDPVVQRYGARMILNVHDELVFTVPDEAVDAFIAEATVAMTQSPAPWWEVPIAVDAEVGPNYGQLKPHVPKQPGWWARFVRWLRNMWRGFWRNFRGRFRGR